MRRIRQEAAKAPSCKSCIPLPSRFDHQPSICPFEPARRKSTAFGAESYCTPALSPNARPERLVPVQIRHLGSSFNVSDSNSSVIGAGAGRSLQDMSLLGPRSRPVIGLMTHHPARRWHSAEHWKSRMRK
jgi:hypothetical protein